MCCFALLKSIILSWVFFPCVLVVLGQLEQLNRYWMPMRGITINFQLALLTMLDEANKFFNAPWALVSAVRTLYMALFKLRAY